MSTSNKLVFNVPGEYSSLAWANYIYKLIKGANKDFLKNQEISITYNNFVKCLDTNSYRFQTWVPLVKYKYGFTLHDNIESFCGIPGRFMINSSSTDIETCIHEIVNSYMPLYNLVKDEVIQYINSKYLDSCKKKEIKAIKNNIKIS